MFVSLIIYLTHSQITVFRTQSLSTFPISLSPFFYLALSLALCYSLSLFLSFSYSYVASLTFHKSPITPFFLFLLSLSFFLLFSPHFFLHISFSLSHLPFFLSLSLIINPLLNGQFFRPNTKVP